MATLKECETEQGRHERMSASIAKVETKPGNPVLYMAAVCAECTSTPVFRQSHSLLG